MEGKYGDGDGEMGEGEGEGRMDIEMRNIGKENVGRGIWDEGWGYGDGGKDTNL